MKRKEQESSKKGVNNNNSSSGGGGDDSYSVYKKQQELLQKTTMMDDIDGALILLTSVKKKAMEAEIIASMEQTLMDRDDERGLWVTGHIVLSNGECIQAYFSYPSEVKPRPTGNMFYCLKLFGIVHSTPNDYSKSEGDPHEAYSDDKFCVQSYQTAVDASFITLMMHPFDINPFGLQDDLHRTNRCNQYVKSIKWIDMDGTEWNSVEGSSLYKHAKSQGNYVKYQFIPDARCREQVKRDLMTPPLRLLNSNNNVNRK